MEEVSLYLDDKNYGLFYISENDQQIAEMQISISGKELTVYHTEVSAEHEGKGLAKKLLSAMVDYARKNQLQVLAFCPYVLARFKRHPDEYGDVWEK
ncbi:MAG TPA: GNAT family N-acetyltransferase [Hanamia sp.]|jgi:uncharacterized protein|nr:GNAT family N-acetyltransferase [Hanamia sp.]